MKKTVFSICMLLLSGAASANVTASINSCTSAFAVAFADDDDNPDGKEIKLTAAEEYALKEPGKRAAGKGVSARESMAQQLAEMNARRQFSDALSAAILSACKEFGLQFTQYAGDDEEGMNIADEGSKATTLVKSISENVIKNTTVVKKNKFFKKKNRRYTIYVCLEYNGSVAEMAEEAAKSLKQKVSGDDRAKLEREMKDFEAEIEKQLKKQNQDEDEEDENENEEENAE